MCISIDIISFKAGEAGIVVLRPEALAAESESEEEDTRPPSPCSVRFVNDNVVINGKSSMAARPTKATRDRAAKVNIFLIIKCYTFIAYKKISVRLYAIRELLALFT